MAVLSAVGVRLVSYVTKLNEVQLCCGTDGGWLPGFTYSLECAQGDRMVLS